MGFNGFSDTVTVVVSSTVSNEKQVIAISNKLNHEIMSLSVGGAMSLFLNELRARFHLYLINSSRN